MPIIFTENLGEELRQGDIIKDVQIPQFQNQKIGLIQNTVIVLSRDCRAIRHPTIIVAEVRRIDYPFGELSEKDFSFDDVRRYISYVRDGYELPDNFYIGTFPDEPHKRYCVNLNHIHTLPRQILPLKDRVARLGEDFCKALHVKLYNSLARVGFDDHKWFPNEDLNLLIRQGEKKRSILATERYKIEDELEVLRSSSDPESKKTKGKITDAEKRLEANRKSSDKLEESLQPYEEEWKSRQQ